MENTRPSLAQSFIQTVFSVKNEYKNNRKHKVLTILGIKIKFGKYEKSLIVKLMGGLGNQMFQYAFGVALEQATKQKIVYDKTWFEDTKTLIINEKDENSLGVVMRKYNLDIFKPKIEFATPKQIANCTNTIFETQEFKFDKDLLKKRKPSIYVGYFQNEEYLENIAEKIKNDFSFPEIEQDDLHNQMWLQKIKNCINPVFVHIRKGDYVNLGVDLPIDYYKNAIDYVKKQIKEPTFFIFGQDCQEYINSEFKEINAQFEIIGEQNSNNKEDWKDMMLMTTCKHAILANSTFSWWAAWLGRANSKGLVIAPSPWFYGEDGIICKNWIKIKR